MFGWVYLYNFLRGADKLISKWKPRCSPFRITYQFWIWPMASYLKDPPCALSTPSTCRCSQWKQYNTVCRKKEIWMFGWVYLYNFLRGADKLISKWKPRCSPFRITYQFWIWPMASYLKDPPCALSTPSTCRCSQWKQYNTVWRKKEIWMYGWVYV